LSNKNQTKIKLTKKQKQMNEQLYKPEDLQKIRIALPFGGMKLLAEKSGYSTGFLSRFFRGQANINKKNQIIISEASKIIRDYQDKSESLKSKVMDCLKRNSTPTKLYNNGTN
jgi:hypothetical protein